MTPYEWARYLVGCKLSVFPLINKNTIPIAWGKHKGETGAIATEGDLKEWFQTKKHPGIGIAHGIISGNTEVLDLETDACLREFQQLVIDHDRADLLDRLTLRVATPSGGWHLYYRCTEGVEGNLKLASIAQVVTEEERKGKEAADCRKQGWKKIGGVWYKRVTKAETRGEGGYTVSTGSLPRVHPANSPYELVSGSFEAIPEISTVERRFTLAMLRATDEVPDWDQVICESEEARFVGESPGFFSRNGTYQDRVKRPDGLLGPLEDYANTATDEMVVSLLEEIGWTSQSRGKGYYVTRSGKKDGHSGTVGIVAPGVLYVFSTNAGQFEADTGYDAAAVFTRVRHNGNKSAAAKELASLGYGTPEEEFKKRMAGERNQSKGQAKPNQEQASENPPKIDWSGIQPRSLEHDLLPVPEFAEDMLPSAIGPWIMDIATRGGFPLAYVAIAALVALSSVIGRQVGICPKAYDDWKVIVNLWGALVGHPGVMKTPALADALKPLHRLERDAREQYESDSKEWEEEQSVQSALKKAAKANLETRAKKGATPEELRNLARDAASDNDTPAPTCRRFLVSDVTIEKLGELLIENPNGLMLLRDELTGFFKTMERQGHENDRPFYLESWNGSGGAPVDRIARGSRYVPAVCISLCGTIQPGPLASYLRHAATGEEADGFMSRLQLLVWPDPPKRYIPVDRYPSQSAKEAAWCVFSRLANIDWQGIGAHQDEPGDVPFLRFDLKAQQAFNAWREGLENRLLSGKDSPLMQMHLAKYRSLVPSLSLIFHLVENQQGPVGVEQVERAIAWSVFLESHARRLYRYAMDGDVQAASALAERLKQSLPNPFTPRQVVQKGWRGLSDVRDAEKACGILVDRGYLQEMEEVAGDRGGRPSTKYFIHPSLLSETDAKKSQSPISTTYKTYKTPSEDSFVGFVGSPDKVSVNYSADEPEFEEGEI